MDVSRKCVFIPTLESMIQNVFINNNKRKVLWSNSYECVALNLQCPIYKKGALQIKPRIH